MMKKVIGLLFVLLIMLVGVACQPETIELEVTREVEIPVEVTVEVPVEVTVEVPVVEEVEVEVTREVEVEVTRIVEPEIESDEEMEEVAYAQETGVTNFPLAGTIAERDSEISAMTWYGDNLILMPQYPNWSTEYTGDGFIYSIPKEALMAYLDGSSFEPITPVEIPFTDGGVQDEIAGFEGYESIAFVGDNVYLTIEVETDDGMLGYLIGGTMNPDLSGMTLDPANISEIASQSGVGNMSDEVMLVVGDQILTIHEASGPAVVEAPVAHIFDSSLADVGTVPLQAPEYRVTDATELDDGDLFWAINYFFPGDEDLTPESDPIADMYGRGPTHAASAGVERLVEFLYAEDGITMTETPPIQLQLMPDGNLRNWEGLVKLDDSGFILVTDKYPFTILGFVPLPQPEEE